MFRRIREFVLARRARAEELDRGASAIEWVIIAAIVVGIVAGVAGVIMNALDDRADSVGECIEGVDDFADC
ncbi:Flp family type IVb pilin [Streptomyces litchfieldiae]|uniref:Integral membrane protein n=1 Tax=Streptomyces litchfieldiae TaxID=3075543 RepID=A0ABU2MPR1_9ACTN|nr:hypothetical protein [Streptomyces sp. DSM 44938]MDT0342893.1 hypothetical protein [Streptomyces sp. DSM 44938]